MRIWVEHKMFYNLKASSLVWVLMYMYILCMQVGNALVNLHICADSPEPSLLTDEISIKISWTGQYGYAHR